MNIKKYGTEYFSKLKTVMLHCPEDSLKIITEENYKLFLFDVVPDIDRYLEEHFNYENMLIRNGVETLQLSKYINRNTDLLNRLPNLAYLHDIAVISSHGSIISKMSSRGRCHEEIVVREALENMGIPTLYEPTEGEDFEGCLLLSTNTVFVADTERHSRQSIERFIQFILQYFDEVIYALIPQERRFMHPDMILNRVTTNLMLYYPPAFLNTFHITRSFRKEINIKSFMNKRKVEMLSITDDEQKRWGCSFVPLEPGKIINYDISLNQSNVNILEGYGVKFIHFHPDALLAGGSSLRCLTMRIWRDNSQLNEKL
ncbi:MAG: arginine deiminase family protein [Bacillota bacterium]|nr:arginine deiminase family protein [Bacillota bacterium]